MFVKRNVIYFTPFYFLNGNTAKPKYFVVIASTAEDTIVASLPTSVNNAPLLNAIEHGCVNHDDRNFNCYIYCKDREICDNGFAFPRTTYIYGNQIDVYSTNLVEQTYKIENVDYNIVGSLTQQEYDALVDCIMKSKAVKRKIKKVITSQEISKRI